MQLSKNFNLSEFTKSDTAQRLKLNNTPNPSQAENLRRLCIHVLQPLREHFNKPVKITSGFRSPAVNRAVGGATNSQHSKGEAADFVIDGVPNTRAIDYIRNNLNFDQLILYKNGWIHVSYCQGNNRKQFFQK